MSFWVSPVRMVKKVKAKANRVPRVPRVVSLELKASKVQPGMELEVGDVDTEVLTVGVDADGKPVASARANIPDGMYTVRVGYKTTQVISLLLN